MLVILAHRADIAAQALVQRWAAHDAHLLSPEELSLSGWRYRPGDVASGCAVISGRSVPFRNLDGVLTRLPWVFEQDLVHIVPDDRAYVAAEMSAFLLAWLSELTCPVVNRPTPTCLAGPLWRPEQWARVASSSSLFVAPVHRRAAFVPGRSPTVDLGPVVRPECGVTLTVVGDKVIGEAEGALREQARSLARAANVELLVVHFSRAHARAEFVAAAPWPDLESPGVADAILARLRVI